MRLTVLILLLPVVTFLSGLWLLPRDVGDAVVGAFLVWWLLTTVVCFVRGCFIFRHHRRLAWCCFGVVLLQFFLGIVPLMGHVNVRHNAQTQSWWSNKSLQATRDGRSSSAVAEDVIHPACLSSGR